MATRRYRIGWGFLCVAAVVVACGGAGAQQGMGPWPEPESAPETAGPAVEPAGAGGAEAQPLGVPREGPDGSGGKRGAPVSGPGVATTFGALALVLGFAIGVAWLVRWLAGLRGGLSAELGAGGRAPSGVLEVLGRYPVGRGQTLVLLKLDRRVLLLSQCAGGRRGGGGFTTLCAIEDADDVASLLMQVRDAEGERAAASFGAALGRHEGAHSAAEGQSIPVVDLTRRDGGAELSQLWRGAGAWLSGRLRRGAQAPAGVRR